MIGKNVTTVVGDVTSLEDLDRLYAVVKEKHGHIDVLFANAGWLRSDPARSRAWLSSPASRGINTARSLGCELRLHF